MRPNSSRRRTTKKRSLTKWKTGSRRSRAGRRRGRRAIMTDAPVTEGPKWTNSLWEYFQRSMRNFSASIRVAIRRISISTNNKRGIPTIFLLNFLFFLCSLISLISVFKSRILLQQSKQFPQNFLWRKLASLPDSNKWPSISQRGSSFMFSIKVLLASSSYFLPLSNCVSFLIHFECYCVWIFIQTSTVVRIGTPRRPSMIIQIRTPPSSPSLFAGRSSSSARRWSRRTGGSRGTTKATPKADF